MKTISIEQLAEKIEGKLWVKGDLKRIYVDAGHNTKKMTTKTYVYEKNARFFVKCTVDCPSQDPAWIYSQENMIISALDEQIGQIIEEFGHEITDPLIAINEELATEEQVQGYQMVWNEVRVPINSYGKLAYRKRQFVSTYRGPASKTPAGFIELNDADFAIACEKEAKATAYEYGSEPNLVGAAERIAELARIEEERQRLAIEAAAAEKEKQAAEAAARIEAFKATGITDPLLVWKVAGCPHPAPIEVAQAKEASGLGWRKFSDSIILP